MSILERSREKRERRHAKQVRKLQKKQWKRIRSIEKKYEKQDFFGAPEGDGEEIPIEEGMLPDARQKYLEYLLHRVGIGFIPPEAVALARKYGPVLATERVCRWLGLDYHKIAAVAPRVATETARATQYFEEIQQFCDNTGIEADPLYPHIHFGSHDTRDILYESFRTSSRLIELYDRLDEPIQHHIGWQFKRPRFLAEWRDITQDCLLQFYNHGLLLSEYQRVVGQATRHLQHECTDIDPELPELWLEGAGVELWQGQFPDFEVIKVQVHLLNRVKEVNRSCAMSWLKLLKQIHDTQFDFAITIGNGRSEVLAAEAG